MRLPISCIALLLSLPFMSFASAEAQALTYPSAPMSQSEIRRIIDHHAEANGLPSELVSALITVESSWHRDARNGSSVGLMQITPGTANALGFRGASKSLFDPETNIALGVRYLAQAYQLADGDLCGTVTRYQSGLNATKANAANRAYSKKMKALLP
ncbi:MAG: transglycosylase SLT domain-containing protein [Beijerinckiaceae bacterium]|nr:transglycosylase SLT domain-containing protein [Beijerinckiaceae bacterium]